MTKLCVDCEYYENRGDSHYCNVLKNISLITGKYDVNVKYCFLMREDPPFFIRPFLKILGERWCGKKGAFWAPKKIEDEKNDE